MASADFGKFMILPLAAACTAAYAWHYTHTTARAEALIQQRLAARDKQWQAFLEEYVPGLPVLNGQLSDTAQQVEQAVVQVCEAFSGMVARAQESVGGGKHDLEAKEKNEAHATFQELVETTREMLESFLARLIQNSTFSMRVVYRMEDIEQGMQEIVEALREIGQVASRTKLLALNTTVEAARFGGQNKGFTVIASEITKLSERSTHASETIRDLVRKVSTDVSQAYQELKEIATANMDNAEESRQKAEYTLAGLGDHNDAMRSSMDVATHNIQMLAQDIAQAVMGLQFQDAVNQRISHVVEALQEMQGAFTVVSNGQLEMFQERLAGNTWTERMQQRYSMMAERQVLVGPVGNTSTDDLGNNVELF